ncbi:MAG: hypothetical protein AAF441_10905 [Pseudomonadota bacterium]
MTLRISFLRAMALCAASLLLTAGAAQAAGGTVKHYTFKQVPTMFIASFGEAHERAGDGAETWGIWAKDPGPRGVWLGKFGAFVKQGGVASARWKFDTTDWWVDENGLLMEKPLFPVPPGVYLVTGERETTTILTVHPPDASGNRRWELANGAMLYDVTHLPCRSARYTPASTTDTCSPANIPMSSFPIEPGGKLPKIPGCKTQDFSVLFVIGVAVQTPS